MNIWENAVITDKGLSLQAKLIAGTTLTITKAVTGAGFVTPGLLHAQTAVTDEKQELAFSSVTYPDTGRCAVPVTLTNEGLPTGYRALQIGLYAMDPDEGEILYFIAQADEQLSGTVVPSGAEMPGYSAEWTFYFQYGQADGVVVSVDPSNTVTKKEFASLVTVVERKAERDLSNVDNSVFLEKSIESGAGIPIVDTEGTGAAYTASVPGMTELKAGIKVTIIPHTNSTTTVPTLDINGLGAKMIRQPLTTNNAAAVAGATAAWIVGGKPMTVSYDGTQWEVDFVRADAANLYGTVDIKNGGTNATTAEDARKNLGAMKEMRDLWVNPDITAEFPAQTLTVDGLSACRDFEFEFRGYTDESASIMVRVHVGEEEISTEKGCNAIQLYVTTAWGIVLRQRNFYVCVEDNTVRFNTGWLGGESTGNSNKILIPYRIRGA